MKVDIYDLEVFPNCHTYAGIDRDTNEKNVFVIHSSRNDISQYLDYLDNLSGLIGYNNLNYDYPLIHFILKHRNKLLRLSADKINELLYAESQRIISSKWSAIRPKNVVIPQLDIFKVKHYDNPAKSSSLKWLQFTLRWEKMQDLPFHWTHIVQDDEIDKLIKYNINDVLSTKKVVDMSKNDIDFRKTASKTLGTNVMNHSDVKIGELMNQLTYEKNTDVSYWDFKDSRSPRTLIKLSDVVDDEISFRTPYLQKFLRELKEKEFIEGSKAKKNNIDAYLEIGGNTFKFAKGGLHSEDIPRVVQVKPGYNLKEKDVNTAASKLDELLETLIIKLRAISSQAYRVGRFRDYLSTAM